MADTSDKKPAVPRFSSFKPKAVAAAPGSGSSKTRERDRGGDRVGEKEKDRAREEQRDLGRDSNDSKEGRSSRDGRDRYRKRRHRDERDRDRYRDGRSASPPRHQDSDSRPLTLARPRPQLITQPSPQPSHDALPVFALDTKGDPFIIQYGRPDRAHVPRYRRFGGGRVLGTDAKLAVHYEGSREQIVLRFPGSGGGCGRRRLLGTTLVANPKRVRTACSGAAVGGQDYVAFETPGRKRKRENGGEWPGHGLSYQPILGKGTAGQVSDDDSDLESDGSSAEETGGTPSSLKQTSMDLSRRVKENPEDVPGWLALVSHQDALQRAGEGPDQNFGALGADSEAAATAAAHSFAEIKLSMLESALRHAKDPIGRELVLLGIMKEGAKVWNADKTAARWKSVLQENSISFPLWKAYLDRQMTNVANFGVDNIKAICLERLAFLSGLVTGNPHDEGIYGQCVYVFLRITRFLCETGFTELAVAAWQAQLEINLFRPAHLRGSPRENMLSEFAGFWESEVLRVGEDGAQGWWRYTEESEPPEPKDDDDDDDLEEPKTRDDSDAMLGWISRERNMAWRCRMPLRTLDAGTEQDPFRAITFADIAGLIFPIPTQQKPALVEVLVDAFLVFCHAPPAWGTSIWARLACEDQFLLASSFQGLKTTIQAGAGANTSPTPTALLAGELAAAARKKPSFAQDGLRMAPTPWTLFAREDWFAYVPAHPARVYCERGVLVDVRWLVTTLRQLALDVGLEGLASYSLAWESRVSRNGVRTAARKLLGRYSTNLELYNAYAVAEWANDNVDMATRVLRSAISSRRAADERVLLLFLTWAQLCFEANNTHAALARLYAAAYPSYPLDGLDCATPLTNIQVLQGRQVLEAKRVECRDGGELKLAQWYSECLMLYEYIAGYGEGEGGNTEPRGAAQGDITAAMRVLERCEGDLDESGREQLGQAGARILYLHSTRGPYRRAFLHEHLARLATLFPRNDTFFALLSWLDPGLPSTQEPFRALLRDRLLHTPGHDGVHVRAMGIHHELGLALAQAQGQPQWNTSRAGAACEQAVRSDVCSASVALWRTYLVLCAERNNDSSSSNMIMSKSGGNNGNNGKTKRRSVSMREQARINDTRQVFYRAAGRCPWSRDLLVRAVEVFAVGLPDPDRAEEVSAVVGTWVKRGLRMHADFDVGAWR